MVFDGPRVDVSVHVRVCTQLFSVYVQFSVSPKNYC